MRGAALIAALAPAAVICAASDARADEIDDLIDLVEEQPAGMDRLTWKEKRREAARTLGQRGDERAVPVLIRVVEEETFDIVGEIAIEALGQLGDPAAIPVLQRVANDTSRDTAQRDKAKQALARLGASADAPDRDEGGGDARGGGEAAPADGARVGGGGRLLGGGDADAPAGPTWGDDVLAATERLTVAVGAASLAWDTVTDQLDAALDARGTFERTVDKPRAAWRYGVDAAVVAGLTNPDGRQNAKALVVTAGGHGEYRAYSTSEVYGFALGRVGLELTRISYRDDDDPNADDRDRWLAVDVQGGFGGGWGRVLDVGARLRVARIAEALERARALGRPIDDDVARRLQAAWWALRGELGTHRRLTATVAILREAGILLGEPDAGTTYELLQILQDGAYDGRASGVDVSLGFAESYLLRSRSPEDEDAGVADGRYELALLRARFARQLGATGDAGGEAFARLRVFAPDGATSPWALGARGSLRRFVYGEHFDPTGALDVAGELALSDDGVDQTDLGLRIGGELGWSVILSRASSIRVAAAVTLDSGELFVGARIEAAYGLLDGVFAASLP